MSSLFSKIITASNPESRNQALDAICQPLSVTELLRECSKLDNFRRASDNLYQKVRALFFLYAIHRFHIPAKLGAEYSGYIPFEGYRYLLRRRFDEAIDLFLSDQSMKGPSDALCSALAASYHGLGFQTLANQVRRSVRSVRGNQWMFRMGHPTDHPLRIRPELLNMSSSAGLFPVLRECTPVRMDLSHSGWSDIFFLGMDFPEGAKVLNISINLGVHGRDAAPRPPVEAYFRVIDEPVIRLTSVDLGATTDISNLAEVFDFAKDYLGLLKAALIASGIVPPGIEGSGHNLADLLGTLIKPGYGLELVSNVNNIPKGSRLAVSTTLLGALISLCMRATGQAQSLTGPLRESERRLVAARAILGEWLGGSGGGWQDSGGLWPGFKLIEGEFSQPGDPEHGISRGRLLPKHRILNQDETSQSMRERLQNSLVLVHGGMAQNVGPILEMVTEKYLLRCESEWKGRQQAIALMADILSALRAGDIEAIGAATWRNFTGPIQTIIPWASNYYTETLLKRVHQAFDSDFWGFWMLGGMSGGGMGFMFSPDKKTEAIHRMQEMMLQAKKELEHALPFAMEPVVYDFSINEIGTEASLLKDDNALLPANYYSLITPRLLRTDPRQLTSLRRREMDHFGNHCRTRPELSGMVQALFDRLLPRLKPSEGGQESLAGLLDIYGFDHAQHEMVRADLKAGRIGLAQNRLPANTIIEDVTDSDVINSDKGIPQEMLQVGQDALSSGSVAIVVLAAGAGSRWTQGAGVVKALHPFCALSGKHRTFIETHIAKARRRSRQCGTDIPIILTTSYLTHSPLESWLRQHHNYQYKGPVLLSPGRSVGLRLIPTVRDLRFAWEEMSHQLLDEQAQKVRDSLHAALIDWAQKTGEGSDYTDNLPLQCLHPVGHWFEVPNLLLNGVLAHLLSERPQLKYLMLHNIDTVGADCDPSMLGCHIAGKTCLSFEVIQRRIEDRGGGLARINGRPRLVEGLAMPREEEEFKLRYYNSMTTWISIDSLLALFELNKADLNNQDKVRLAIRKLAAKMPTYITLKDVKKRWGHGQEDIFPVAQFEKLWSDLSSLPDIESQYIAVPRMRGQQLKDQAQLDGWLRDGSAAFVTSLCDWE